MEQMSLGRTDTSIPLIGIGTSRYSGGVDPIRRAIELGAGFIDTAERYGSEDVVGQAVEGLRERAFIATKVSPDHFRPADLREAVERSLRLLQTDYIDLYQLHRPNPDIPIAETMGTMEQLVDEGKVRFIGVSNFGVEELREAQQVMQRHPIVSNQIAFSLLQRRPLREVIPYCRAQGITIVAHSPLGSPFTRLVERDRRQALERVARRRERTAAQVALNWCLATGPMVLIPKTNNAERVNENCGGAGWALSAAERAEVEASVEPLRPRSRLEAAARRRVRGLLNRVGVELPSRRRR